jgi:GDP-4-dehydro-6-deoxy-D-mannose reductase
MTDALSHDAFRGRRVLVTGATGFVGTHLVPELIARGCDVTCLVRKGPGPSAPVKLFFGDINVPESFRELPRDWDYVIHLAGISIPANIYSEKGVLDSLGAAMAVLEHLRSGRLLLVSSAHVYAPSLAIRTEESPITPQGRYGMLKVLIEQTATYYRSRLDVRIARPFNHVGPGMRSELLIPSALRRLAALSPGEPLVMNGFDSIRDFIDVRDVISGYLAILAVDAAKNGCFNVSTGKASHVSELLGTLMELKGKLHPITFKSAPSSEDDNPSLVGSPEKLTRTTGWTPRFDLRASCQSVIDGT